MSKPKVLLLGTIDYASEAFSSLQSVAELIEPKSTNRADFIEECKTSPINECIACFRTFFSTEVTGKWDKELVAALPSSLKSVSHNGAGYDQLNIPALSSRGILATNVPTAVDDATADTGIFLLLGALRNFNSAMFALRAGEWRGNQGDGLGHDPQGKLLGVVGMGGIGRNFARKCRAFGMEIQYYNRSRLDPELEEGAKYVSFEELLKTSDVVSMNLPLNQHTRHSLGKRELAMCKKGVVVVNTARGAVIDEAALVEALESGQVGAVGLDVFEEEPKVHPGLIKNDKAFLLPHMGTATTETIQKMEEWCLKNVRDSIDWHVNGNRDAGKQMSVVSEQRELHGKLLAEKS